MNSYSAVKKSFFSKLTVLFVLVSMVGSMILPAIVFGQGAASSDVPGAGWRKVSTDDTFTRSFSTGGMGAPTVITRSFNYIRGTEGYGSTGAQGKFELRSDEGGEYVGAGLNKHLGTDYPTDSIYSITTKVNGKNVTNYYVSATGANAPDGNAKVIAFANENGLFLPPAAITKLGKNSVTDLTSTDITTEAGVNNWFDEKAGREKGSLTNSLRNNDSSLGNIEQLKQQRDNLQKQIDDLNNKIDEIDAKETAGTINDADRQNRDSFVAQRDLLLNERNLLENQRLNTQMRANGSEITLDACNGWLSLVSPACWVTMIAIVANIGMKLVSYALALTGLMFDYSIELAVNSAEFINAIGVVEPVWTFLRDLLNMTFIFVLVWIAIHIILQKRNYTIKGDVVRVVIVAILINFSLFAAKAMVDGSNILTLQLYEATKSKSIAGTQGNISNRIMNTLGFQTIFDFNSIFGKDNVRKTIPGCGNNAMGAIIAASVFGSIFMLVLIFAFLMVGLLFFTRMANIIYLFVTSPLWVWGHIMDGGLFAKIKNDWWKRMSVVLKFPVIFMLFMFVSIFVFTKLFGLNGGLGFVSMFCASDDNSILAQLPLILNFCLVIWIVLAAIKYGRSTAAGGIDSAISNTIGGWANATSLGLAAKLGAKARQVGNKAGDAASKAGDMAAEGLKKAPRAVMYTAGQVAKGSFQALGGFKGLNKAGRSLAGNANLPASVRTAGGKLADKTKDPKIFGWTIKQYKDAWNKESEGKVKDNTNRNIDNVEAANKPPEWREGESEAEYRDRIREFSKKTAKTFLDSSILSTQDPDHGDLSHETMIADAAMDGVKIEMDPTDPTKIKSAKFNQTNMRQKITDAYMAHMPDGRLAKIGYDTHKYSPSKSGLSKWLLNNARREARQKAFRDQAAARITPTGSKFKANTKDIGSLKDQLKKSEEDLRKHPLSIDHIDVLLKDDPEKLKGILDPQVIEGLKSDITELEANIGYDEHHLAMTADPIAQANIRKEIDKNKKKKKAKEDKIKSTKEKVIKTRETIQKKVNQLNTDIQNAEEKAKGGGDKDKKSK